MVPKPSWLKFKRWRSKGASHDQQQGEQQQQQHQLPASQSGQQLGRDEPPPSPLEPGDECWQQTGLRLISEQPNPAQRASSSECEKHDRGAQAQVELVANHQANESTAAAAAHRGRGRSNRRRLCELMPRALTQLIERAVSPNVRRTAAAAAAATGNQQPSRPKSPLRKLHKHLKQSQEQVSSQAAQDKSPRRGPQPQPQPQLQAPSPPESKAQNSSQNHHHHSGHNRRNDNDNNNEAQPPLLMEISNVQPECNERDRLDCDSSGRAEAADQSDQRRHSSERPKPLVTGGPSRQARAKASPKPQPPLPPPPPPPPEGAYNRSVNEVTRAGGTSDERRQREELQQPQPSELASSTLCQLSAKTRDNHCALHGSNVALCRPQPAGNETPSSPSPPPPPAAQLDAGTKSRPGVNAPAAKRSQRKRRTPREKARSVSTWPLAKQTLDNNLPNEFRLGHFGDCEDLLSAHLAGRLFGALTAHDLISIQRQQQQRRQDESPRPQLHLQRVPHCEAVPRRLIASDNHRPDLQLAFECQHQQPATATTTTTAAAATTTTFDQLIFQATSDALKLADQLRAFNYNHKRPFALPFETPPTGWLFNATGMQPINSGSAHALRAKLFASNKFRRRSYDDQEGDNDINIILQPSDIDDIEKRARLGYARLKATTKTQAATAVAVANRNGQPKATTTTTTTTATTSETSSSTNNDQDSRHTTKNHHSGSGDNQRRHTSREAHKLKAFEGIFEDIKLAKCLLDQDYNQTVRLFIERSALNWNFNSFTFDALCCGRSLTELLEFGYHSTNPYHNSVHAADVTQAMHCFIQEQKIRSHMTDLEILCSILAAVCHDLDHPGVNQSFLVATNNPLASLYQNNSVLENHHWRFALCIFKESKLFDHFDELVLEDMKQQLKQLILATDIARQNDYLKRFKALTSSDQFSMSNTEDRALVLQMALKCADLGNPCRPWLISRVWSNLICDEFYRMGQIERRLGVPLTPICQRNKTSIAGIQTDFFRFIVLPLLELWHNFLSSPLSDLLMANFDHNYQRWQRANRIVQQLRRRKSVASLEPVKDLPGDYEPSNRQQNQTPASAKQLRSMSLIQSSLVEVFAGAGSQQQRRDSFELIKRASSDYIKSGNGRLESLRDFQLNRIIEKSPIISRLVIEPLN